MRRPLRLHVCGAASLLARLEAICVALEHAQDTIIVCAEACEGGTAECTAVARTLKYGAANPLAVQLSLLSSTMAALRDGETSEN